MIRYHLGCAHGHEFESWFHTIDSFDTQARSGAVACPLCGSTEITKQPMAPAVVSARRNAIASQDAQPLGDQRATVLEALRALKHTVLKNSEDVGAGFADEARKIHFGEAEERNIRGSSTPDEARALFEDGVTFGILPPLPEDLN